MKQYLALARVSSREQERGKRPIQLASLGKISSLGPSVSFLGLACFLLVFSVGPYRLGMRFCPTVG